MLPESLAPSLREQLSRTGMVAEGPGRGPQRRCASRRPERKYPRAGIPRRGSGFCAAHAFDRSGAESASRHHMYDQTFQRLQTCRRTSRHHEARHTAHPPPLVRDGLAPQRLRHSNRADLLGHSGRLYDDDLHACAGKLAVPECVCRLMRCRPSLVR